MYEYGLLQGDEQGTTIKWTFSDYKEKPIEYDYRCDFIECLNRLGEDGWQLSTIVKDTNGYVLYRQIE